MNKRKMAKLEKKIPEQAVAALNAASERAAASTLPRTVVIDNGLYRINASGATELVRMLPPRTRVPGGAKRPKV